MSQTMKASRAAVVSEDRNREPVIADSAGAGAFPGCGCGRLPRNREPSIVDRARRDRRPPVAAKKPVQLRK